MDLALLLKSGLKNVIKRLSPFFFAAFALAVLYVAATADAAPQAAGGAGAGATGGSGGAKGASGGAVCKPTRGVVAYADLKSQTVTLPYGAPFTVTGTASGVTLTGAPDTMDKSLKLQTVAGSYKVTPDGTTVSLPLSAASGGNWNVTIGQLAPDSSITLNLEFTGTPTLSVVTNAFDELFQSPAYVAALTQFVKAAEGKAAPAQVAASALFAQAAADALTAALAEEGLAPRDPAALKNSLNSLLTGQIGPLFNAQARSTNLVDPGLELYKALGMTADAVKALSADELYDKLMNGKPNYTNIGDQGTRNAVTNEANAFIREYAGLLSSIQATLKTIAFTGTSSLVVGSDSASDVACDLLKYAGFDVGAMYTPRLNDMRAFAMLHIYFGPVQLSTSATAGTNTSIGEALRQRLSLAVGFALKDLSGATNSKISGENAFAYGIGFRLNKYFRLTAGGLLYRTTLPNVAGTSNATNGTLRNEFFVGPSVDITALPALQSILAKAKSN